MRVRLWSVDVRTRLVKREVRHAKGQFTAEVGAGKGTLRVNLNRLLKADRSGIDVDEVERVLASLEPGARTIIATDERRRCLGEWLIDSRFGTSPEGGVSVGLMSWEVLPSMRVLQDAVSWEGIDQYVIGRDILNEAFNQGQGAEIVGMPPGNSGVLRTLTAPARSCYHSDLMRDVSEAHDGFEWAVDTTVTWHNGAPYQVHRRIVFGSPVLDRGPDTAVFDQDVPGSRRGRAVSVTGGVDWNRSAQQVTGRGGGDGGRSPEWCLNDPDGPILGRLRTEKILSFRSVLRMDHLQGLVQGELEQSKSGAASYGATAFADRLETWPIPGATAWLYANAGTWCFPRGINLFVRIGRVTWNLTQTGDVVTVSVVGVDGSDRQNPDGGVPE